MKKRMKIGFIGNSNNYPLPLALAMRAQGIDVRFFVDSALPLNRPEARLGTDAAAYGDWWYDLAPIRTWHIALPSTRRRRALALLAECDALVANGLGIALAAQVDRPAFVICSGSDLDMVANEQYLEEIPKEGVGLRGKLRAAVKLWLYKRLVPLQRAGIRKAVGVEYALPGVLPHGDALFDGIGVPLSKRHAFMFTELAGKPPLPAPGNDPLRLLCVARINWVEPLPPGFQVLDNKRTDILLRGVALFLARHPLPLKVRLVSKGLHVPETKALIDELGLSQVVEWFGEMNQEAFGREIAAADIVADHFGDGVIGMGARDAMAIGRPVIANAKNELFEHHLGEGLPIASAKTPEEVAAALEHLSDPQRRADMAERGRDFAARFFSADVAARAIADMLARAAGADTAR